jgi:UDPglucose 6-dehydrogenase
MKITIIGSGYVGLVTGAVSAYFGHEVTFLDVDQRKIDMLRAGESPIYEPGLTELLRLSTARIYCTTDGAEALPEADIIFITVGTPFLPDGSPNMQYVRECAWEIGQYLNGKYKLIVNKSTVPIGSGNWVESIICDSYEDRHGHLPDSGNFSVASNPEFLKEGTALHDTFYPDRIVIGSGDTRAISLLSELYRPLLNQDFMPPSFLPRPDNFGAAPLVTTDLASAEMIKYAANAFLTVKISFINEMAFLAGKVGADVRQISRGIGLDSRIGPRFLQAGLGWGGSCFGKDTSALISMGNEYGAKLHIVEAARQVNCMQRERAIETIQHELKIIKGRTVGILGLAFKPNTDDLRDSPALDIAKRLTIRGAKVTAHDPVALERARDEARLPGVCYKDDPADVFNGSDAVILATEWEEYRGLPYAQLRERMKTPLLVDGRNFLDSGEMESFGYRYYGVGR